MTVGGHEIAKINLWQRRSLFIELFFDDLAKIKEFKMW
jgi:hypothetical protein